VCIESTQVLFFLLFFLGHQDGGCMSRLSLVR
jgi:hypothetical protein